MMRPGVPTMIEGFLLERLYLPVDGSAADEERGLQTKRRTDLMQNLFHLQCEFARRKNDESLFAAQCCLNERNAKRKRFTGPGLGEADEVLSLDRKRDRFCLNRRRYFKARFVENA